jgi:hypothetical protein
MDCKAVQKVIYRFVYGESDAVELQQIKRHLERCKDCEKERALINDILDRISAGAENDTERMPTDCRNRILAAIHRNMTQPSGPVTEDRAG